MLLELTIDHLALIDNLTLEFGPGFNVMTGETGAGKSIVVDAVNLVLGERADRELIQIGTDKGRVEALFDVTDNPAVVALLHSMEFEAEENLVSISRELTAAGRNICRLCGQIVPLSIVRQISALLLDIHGQHEHQFLMDEKHHLSYLDDFAGEALAAHKQRVSETYKAWHRTRSALEKLRRNAAERERRIDMLRYQIKELKGAKLRANEEEALERTRGLFRNAEKISDSVGEAYAAIYEGADGDLSALEQLRNGMNALSHIAPIDAQYEALHTRLEDIYYQLEDAALELRGMRDHLDYDPQEAERVETRLDLISRLRKKYGATTQEMLDYLKKAEEELAQIEDSDAQIEEMTQQYQKERTALWEASRALSRAREEAARRFEKQIEAQLQDLGMKNARFEVRFEPLPQSMKEAAQRFTAHGMDQVSFMMTANLGQPLKPLARVASGGELSRIMLALKNIAAEKTGIPSMVFDEIDTGISGRMAQVVAEKMTEIAGHHQVICVTHLPQIAAMADTHFLVSKNDMDGKTRTSVVRLDDAQRAQELSRMIGGAQAQSESSLSHACAMLKEAQARKDELRNDHK